jgi:hypothetical protein
VKVLSWLSILVLIAGVALGLWFFVAGLWAGDLVAALGGLFVVAAVLYSALR